jgi:phosphoglycolate phosphatase-like HAD superfamily hydrolase
MPFPIIFLDDGGVMNDNLVRAPQWQVLLGEFLPPILGGTPEAWAEANHRYMTALFDPAQWEARLQTFTDYPSWDAAYHLEWINDMCAIVGVPPPPAEAAIELAHQASDHVIPQVRSALPGATDAIFALHAAGHTLHTASGESSRELNGYLTGMGVRHCFGRLYGPDLINFQKMGPAYYARLLADCEVAPEAALIVDDSPKAAAWIAEAGARPLLVNPAAPLTRSSIPALADLPAWLEDYA